MDEVTLNLLKKIFGEKRHCYDHTGEWHLFAATRDEYKAILEKLGMEMPGAKFNPKKRENA